MSRIALDVAARALPTRFRYSLPMRVSMISARVAGRAQSLVTQKGRQFVVLDLFSGVLS